MQEAGERAEVHGEALHLTANLFAVAFGVAGLAQAWSAVTRLAGASDWPGNALWIVAAVTSGAGIPATTCRRPPAA
jgi:hypothetical protein